LKLSPKAKTERDAQISEHKTDANLCKYIHENYSSWWRCTCGAINFDRANCHKCNLGLDILPALECESELVEKYNEKKSKLKAAALKRKRKSIKIVVIITAIIILLAAVIGGGYMASQTIIPDIRYSGKYDYVQNNKDASNEQTKEYLTELADADYKDSKDIYSELYAKWNIEISFTRSSKKDYLKMKYTLKQSDATLDTSAAHMQGTLTFTYEDNSTEVKKINYALSRTNDDETKQVLVDVDNVSNIKKIDVDATLDDGTKVSKTFSF
jgi:flagellar basal body-associated protein FliL